MGHYFRMFAIKGGAVFVGLAMLTIASCSQRVDPASRSPEVVQQASLKSAAQETGKHTHNEKTTADTGGKSAVEMHQVNIDNFRFSPAELTIPAGATVTWINHDDVPHTATSSKKPRDFDSGTLDTDQEYSHKFTTAGTYNYFCAVHPHMTGKIIVK